MSKSVLIVEDEIVLARNLAATFRKAGFSADCAATLGEARACLASRRYAAMCLDLSLPDGNGLDLVNAARAHCGDIPIVVVTGQDTLENRRSSAGRGISELVAKPFSLQQIVMRLETLVDSRSDDRVKGGVN